jgi:Raf kinase inhibitor-like YbhB/YbcL family protein
MLMAVEPAAIVVTSPAVRAAGSMPAEYTADGINASPAVAWRALPNDTRQLIVHMQDDDEVVPAPFKPPLIHWLVYNVPPEVNGLPRGIPFAEVLTEPPDLTGAAQAYTTFSYPGYRGPQPPPGELHHYRLVVLALNRDLGLHSGLPVDPVLTATAGHVIGRGELAFTYRRRDLK